MAIDTGAYYYLFDPVYQIENNAGKPLVGGHIEVFEAGTDNKVITLQDWDGTCNPFKIPLKSDGRAVILVDIGKRYDAYVYDSFNNLAFSRLNILPLTTGDVTVNGMTKVYHDNSTLSGDGTPQNPLKVIGGGGGELSTVITQWPVEGNGSQEDPVTVKDITLLATDDTLTSYDAEIEGKQSIVIGVNGDWFNEATDKFQTKAGMNNYVTNNTLISQINVVRNDINTVDAKFDNYYDKSTIDSDYAKKTDIPSLEGYATESFVTNITDNKLDTSVYSSTSGDFALKSEIPSVVGFMEESKLEYNADNLISGYNGSAFAGQGGEDIATKTWVNDQGFAKESDIPSLDGYATESWVESKGYITNADFPSVSAGDNIDVSYDDTTKVYTVSGKDWSSEIPSLDGYATEQWVENKNYLVSDDISGKADKSDLSNYYPITGGNLNGKLVASGTGSVASAQAAVIYAKVTNTSTNNQAGLGTNGSVWAGDYTNATSQTIGVRRKVGDKKLAGRFQLYSDGNVSFQQIENSGTDSIICQLQYGNTTSGNNWGTMTFGDETKHIAYTEDIVLPVIGTIDV